MTASPSAAALALDIAATVFCCLVGLAAVHATTERSVSRPLGYALALGMAIAVLGIWT